MKELILHVERLLAEHDCVAVPGLGGFVLNEVCVRADHDHEVFHPRGKEISFNVRLTFNDGILVQSFQEAHHCSFETAVEIVHEKVRLIHQQLEEGRYIGFGRLGTLLGNEQGQLVFRPDNRNLFCPESYGLTSFAFPTLENRLKIKQAEEKRKGEYIHIRFRRHAFSNFLTGAAACLLMLLISKPVGYLENMDSQQAFLLHSYVDNGMNSAVSSGECEQNTGFLFEIGDSPRLAPRSFNATTSPIKSTEPITKPTNANEEPVESGASVKSNKKSSVPSTDDIDSLFGLIKTTRSPINSSSKKAMESIQTPQPVKETEQLPQAPVVVQQLKPVSGSSNAYYIIISSHPAKAIAQRWLEKNKKGLYQNADIIEKDGRARIYITHFDRRTEAESYLKQFRSDNPQHADAWLLCTKI